MRRMMRDKLWSASRDSNASNNAMNDADLRASGISLDLQSRNTYIKYLQNVMRAHGIALHS